MSIKPRGYNMKTTRFIVTLDVTHADPRAVLEIVLARIADAADVVDVTEDRIPDFAPTWDESSSPCNTRT